MKTSVLLQQKKSIIKLLGFVFLMSLCISYSQVPKMISYQGVLTDSQNQLVQSGTYSMTFKLYDLKSGGSLLWQETQNVAVVNGLFNVILGSVVSVNLTFDRQYFLEIEATYNAVSYKFPERVQLTSVAYAFKAMTVEEKPYLKELKDVDITTPTAGQVLKFDGNKWKPDADNTSSGGNNGVSSLNSLQGDLTITQGNNINISKNTSAKTLTIDANITSISPNIISQGGAQNNQVLKWNGINWTPANDDITTNISLSNIQQSGANSGQIPKWDGKNWVAVDDAQGVITINGLNNMVDIESGTGINVITSGGNKIKIEANITPDDIKKGTADTNQILKWNGTNWTPNKDETVPVGSIIAFGGTKNTIPIGWFLCDGTPLSSTNYPDLYAVIGTAWGTGSDGSGTNFNLPDLRGLFLRGVTEGVNRDPDASNRTTTLKTGQNTGNSIGSFQDDAYQGHWHNTPGSADAIAMHVSSDKYLVPGSGNQNVPVRNSTDFAISRYSYLVRESIKDQDTPSYGVPKTTSETRPKNAYVYYIIKVK